MAQGGLDRSDGALTAPSVRCRSPPRIYGPVAQSGWQGRYSQAPSSRPRPERPGATGSPAGAFAPWVTSRVTGPIGAVPITEAAEPRRDSGPGERRNPDRLAPHPYATLTDTMSVWRRRTARAILRFRPALPIARAFQAGSTLTVACRPLPFGVNSTLIGE